MQSSLIWSASSTFRVEKAGKAVFFLAAWRLPRLHCGVGKACGYGAAPEIPQQRVCSIAQGPAVVRCTSGVPSPGDGCLPSCPCSSADSILFLRCVFLWDVLASASVQMYCTTDRNQLCEAINRKYVLSLCPRGTISYLSYLRIEGQALRRKKVHGHSVKIKIASLSSPSMNLLELYKHKLTEKLYTPRRQVTQ